MTLSEDVKYLEKNLDQIQSVEQLRALLARKKLKLIVVFISNEFSCLEWNITQKQVSKVLDLGLRIRLSRISDESHSLETVQSVPIREKEPNWIDLDKLFETLKVGIKSCIQKSTLMNKDE